MLLGNRYFSIVAMLILVCIALGQHANASQQTEPIDVVKKALPVDEPGVARFIRDENGVSIIEFAGSYDKGLRNPRETIAKEFYRTHADVYDFLVVFSSFEFPTADALAFYNSVRNDTQGIGRELMDNSRLYGSQGVLQGYVDMAATTRWSSETSNGDYETLLSVFAHELQHRWGSFIKFRDWNGKVSQALLGKDGDHWSYLLDTQGSVMYGSAWRDNGDGAFTAIDSNSTYSPLDLYLAGLIDKSKVPPFTLIEAPDIDAKALPPPVGTTIRGTKRTVTIDDVIAVEGPRIPGADISQKSFRFGFIYLTRTGETIDPEKLKVVTQARRQVGLRYNALTHGMGVANVFSEPATTQSPGTPSTTLPPDGPPSSSAGNSAAGLSWLKNQQKLDGSFMDAAGLAPRDTLLARSYFLRTDPGYSGIGTASAWIAARALNNTDFLARKLIESSAGERRAEDVSSLLSIRNTDGGWGLGEGLGSNPLDTALAVQALRLSNADSKIIQSASDLLHSWQNGDGGWGNAPKGPSRVQVTAQVLKALFGLDGLNELVVSAKGFIKSKQNSDGGFGDQGSSIHDTAHAFLAMTQSGFGADINVATAQKFAAESQRLDGSWQGSVYSTVLALQLLRNSSAANLAIGNLQISPQPIFDGQRVNVSARVSNTGATQSAATSVRFFDGDPNSGGIAMGAAVSVPALVGGDSVVVQGMWNTSARAGQRTVYAVVDFEQVTGDLNRQDNTTSLSVQVQGASPLADVLLADGDVLATPSTVTTLPSVVQIDALISNAGLRGVTSAKAVLWAANGGARKLVGEANFDVGPRATTSVQFRPTLSESGTTTYTVELDPDGLLQEATRANNSGSVVVKTGGGVSLAVAKPDITLNPATPKPGSDAVFSVRLHNTGTLDSASFNVRYSVKSEGGTTVILSNVVQIAAGSAIDQNIPWRAAKGGAYSFIVEMDPEKVSGDSNIADNTAAIDFKVSETAGLNLAVSYKDMAFAPNPALEGVSMTLSAQVRNVGDVASSGFNVRFYDGDPSAGGIPLGSTSVAALAAGASALASVNWEVPTAAERLIFVVVDPERSQSGESSLDDNTAFAELRVLTLPDFAVSQGALSLSPSIPKPGDPTVLTAKISNLGEQAASGVIVSAFSGSQEGGVKLAPDVVLPTLAGKAAESVQFTFNAPAASGVSSITVVVNPQFAIKERVRDNNTASISLGIQEGNFSVTEAFISPNGDGIKDSTTLTYRLPVATPVTIQVMDERGSVVRVVGPKPAESSGSWQWDGLDGDGRLVQDGRYELTVRNADGVVYGGATVEVDTNRSPLLAAMGTPAGINAGLTCTIASPISDVRSIRDGAGFYLSAPTTNASNADTALQAGIYRVDDWGRGMRLVLAGLLPPDINEPYPQQWDSFVANDQGTKIVAYNANRKQLVAAGGEGEGKRVIYTKEIGTLIGLSKDDSEVFVHLMDGSVSAIHTSTGAQRSLGLDSVGNIRLSPDKQRLIADKYTGETVWQDTVTGVSKLLPSDSSDPTGNYYWSPKGTFLVGSARERMVLLDADGNPFSEVSTKNQYGAETWAEDSSELYLPLSSKCLLSADGNSLQCSGSIQRIDINSGDRAEVKSFTKTLSGDELIGFEGMYDAARFVSDLTIVPGRYELLVELSVQNAGFSDSSRNRQSKKVVNKRIKSETSDSGFGYRLIDLRSNAISTLNFDGAPPPIDILGANNLFSLPRFIEYGRALQYHSSQNPAKLNSCAEKAEKNIYDSYVFRTLSNLQTDLVLSRNADGVSVKIRGGVADKNFSRYWLEYASDDAPASWRPISPASTTAVWDKDLAVWVTPGVGRYTVRLTAEDLAGNLKQKLRRVTISEAGPPITNVVREPAFISPNGDGSKDEMKLSYRVLEPVNLEFSIFNQQGALVRSLSRNHPIGAVDAFIVWDGRDNNGQIVVDGEYRINVVGFDFFVNVDNSAPVINTLASGPPFSCGDIPCRSTQLRWSVSDVNFESTQIETGEGSSPSKWGPYGQAQKVADTLNGKEAVYLPLAHYAGQRYRLTAIDLAGNRTVAQFEPAQQEVRLVLAGPILSRDLIAGETALSPVNHGELISDKYHELRPAAGIAMVFAETLNDPVVAASVQFNETPLAEKGDWLEQPNVQIYPMNAGQKIPYLLSGSGNGGGTVDFMPEQSAMDGNSSVPQNYGLVGFFNSNIPADQGMSLRLKLTGKSGVQYLTNEIVVADSNRIGISSPPFLSGGTSFAGNVELKTSRIARKLEVFISSADDPYFSIERRILSQELNYQVPEGSRFGFGLKGRFVSCATYKVRAVATLENGQVLQVESGDGSCGGVSFKVRPEFAACGEGAVHQLRAVARPEPSISNVDLLSLEVYAEYPNGARQLVFNVVNPEYKDYEFTFDHGSFAEGNISLVGITTDRDGVKRSGSLVVPIDHTPATLKITYPQENQRVCAVPELHERGEGMGPEMVNVLRPVVEMADAAGLDYLQQFTLGDEDENTVWQPVNGNLPSLHYPDPKGGPPYASAKSPYTIKEYLYSDPVPQGARPYMSAKRIAGELGPIINISGQVTTRVTAYDWSGAQVCRQVSFYLDGSVDVGPASVDQRLFSPGTGSSLGSMALSINPMEPVNVTVVVRRVITSGDKRELEEGAVRRLATNLPVLAGQRDLVWDGKDDGGNYVADGEYTFDIRYEDGCGNLKAPSPSTLLDPARQALLVEVDRTPPALLLERPLAGEVTSSFLDIIGSVKDKHLQQWVLEYSLDTSNWTVLASKTAGTDLRKLAVLDANGLEGVITLRLSAVDKVELRAEITRALRLKPRTELIRKFVVSPTPFSPNGDARRDALQVTYDVLQAAIVDLTVKRGGVVVKHLLLQSLAVPGERVVVWDGRNDISTQAPDGEYMVEIRAVSSADQTNAQTETSSVVLDSTAPLLTLNPPLSSFMPGNVALKGTVADLSLNGYQIYIEGPLPGTKRTLLAEGSEVVANSLLGTLSQLGLDDARYRIRMLATDDAENATDFQSVEFELDSKAPVVSFSNPASGTFVSQVRPADISGLLEDHNLESVELKINGDRVFAQAAVSASTTLTFPFDGTTVPDGSYAVQLIGLDKAGNVGLANSTILVDNTPPLAQITAPVPHAAIGTMVPVVGTASDANMEFWKLELGSGVGQNLQSLTTIARGTKEITAGELAKLVGLPPDGPATLRLTVVDKGGNTSVFDVPLQIDATVPDAPTLLGQREQRNDVRLGWTFPGDVARIAGYNLYRNNAKINAQPLTELEYLDAGLIDGNYAYTVTALSHSGVESARSNVVNIAIKSSGPVAQINKPANSSSVGGLVSIEGSAYAVKNFRAYQVSIGEGLAPTTWSELRNSAQPVQGDVLATWSTAGLPENAIYTIRLTAQDIEGGTSDAQVSVSIDNLAPAKPLGLQAQLSGSQDVSLKWAANSEPDLAGYLLYRDGQLVNQIDPSDNSIAPYLLSATNYVDKARPDGTFVYTVVAVDKANNQSIASDPASVRVDNRAPQAVIVQPADGASVDGVVYVRASSPDTDIASVQFEFKLLADTAWSAIAGASSKAPYSVNWNTQGLPNGSYQLRAVATDMAGHVDPAPAAITVVRKNLQRPLPATQLRALVDGGDVNLSWTASASSGVLGYHVLRIDAQNNVTRLTTTAVAGTSFVDRDLPDAHYQYQVLAVNSDNNESDATPAAPAVVYSTLLKQPYTPVVRDISPLSGSSPNAADAVVVTVTPEAGAPDAQTLTPDGQGKFSTQTVPLAIGANMLTAQQTDGEGNRSKAGTARVARSDPPAAPTSVQAAASSAEYHVTWQASASTDVAGYVMQVDGEYNPAPFVIANATASSAQGSYASAYRAIDANAYTVWAPDSQDAHPHLELEAARKELMSELSISWTPYPWDVPPSHFAIEAWDGYVWVPLKEETANAVNSLQLMLDPPYYTDRVRISFAKSADFSNFVQVADVKGKSLAVIVGTQADVPATDGVHTVSVQALNTLGLLSAPASASPVGIGDTTAPPPVVASTSVSGALVTVSWTESVAPDLAKYEVLRDGVVIAQVLAGDNRVHIDGPLNNGSYIYTVRPLDVVGNLGDASNEAVAVVASSVPDAPLQLSLQAPAGGGALRLVWQAPQVADAVASYAVYRAGTAGGPYSMLGTTDFKTLTYLDTSVSNGTHYYYVVRARDVANNESAPSNEVSGVAADLAGPLAPVIFYPTDAAHPIQTEQGSTSVRLFSEPGAQVTLYRDGVTVGSAPALNMLVTSSLAGSVQAFEPASHADLVAVMTNNGALTISRVSPTPDGRTSSVLVKNVPAVGYGFMPSWSPDASQLVLSSGYSRAKVVQVADGSVVDSAFDEPINEMVWHPDGQKWIAVTNGGGALVEIQPTSGASRALATAVNNITRIAVSPDGRYIAYVDGSQLVLLSSTDSQSVMVAGVETDGAAALAWSADSKSIYFKGTEVNSTLQQVYRLELGQATPSAMTNQPNGVDQFALSPSGILAVLSGAELSVLSNAGQAALVSDSISYISRMDWASSGVLFATGNMTFQSLMLPGTAVFPPVQLKAGENLLTAQATDASANVGVPSDAISVTYNMAQTAKPDFSLQASDVTVLPQIPQVGVPARISVVVSNRGAAAAASAGMRIIAISPKGVRLELLNARTREMAAGGSEVFRADTAFSEAGNWQLSLAVDPDDEVSESSEDNNVLVVPVRVVAAGSARTAVVSIAESVYQVGDTLNGEVTLFNGMADVEGQLKLSVEDAQGYVVAQLPAQSLSLLPYGQSRVVNFSWSVPAIFDGSYKVRAVWVHGTQELAQSFATFKVVPHVQIGARIASDSSVYSLGSIARLLAQIDPAGSSPTATSAQASIRVLKSDGSVVMETSDAVGLTSASQLNKTLDTGGLSLGSYTAELTVRYGDQVLARSNTVFEITSATAPVAVLAGDITLDRSSLPYTGNIAGTAIVRNIGKASMTGFQYEVVVIDPRSNSVLAYTTQNASSLGAGEELRSNFSFAAGGMPMGALWVQLRSSVVTKALPLASELTPHLLKQQEVSLFELDPPTAVINQPTAGAYLRGAQSVLAAATDLLSGVRTVEFQVDGGSWKVMTLSDPVGSNYTGVLPTLADGTHQIAVRATDNSGNVSSPVQRSFVVDSVAPVISISGVTDTSYTSSVSPSIVVTDLNLSMAQIQLNGATYVSGTPIVQAGAYVLQVDAVDLAGNTSSKTVRFTISASQTDTVPPVIDVKTPMEGAYIRRGAGGLGAVIVDAESAVAAAEWSVDAGAFTPMAIDTSQGAADFYAASLDALADGQHSIVVRAADTRGNQAASSARNFTVDNAPPVISITGVSAGQYTAAVTPVVAITDSALASSAITLNGNAYASGVVIDVNGDYILTVNAADKAGNLSTASVQFSIRLPVVDTTAPAVFIEQPAEAAHVKRGATLMVSATDTGSGVASVEQALDGTTQWARMELSASTGKYVLNIGELTDGLHSVSVRAADNAGNVSDVLVRQFTVDNTVPSVLVSGVANDGQYTGSVSPAISISDSHLSTSSSMLNGNPFVSGSAIVTPGDYALIAAGRDIAGNETVVSVKFRVLAGNANEPSVTIQKPGPNAVVKSGSMLEAVGAPAAEISRLEAAWGAGAPFTTMQPLGNGSYAASIAALPDGVVTVRVRAVGVRGDVYSEVTRQITIDNTAPVIELLSVKDAESYPVNHVVLFQATDAHLLSISSTLDGMPFSAGQRVSSLGRHELQITALDRAGNQTQQTLVFTIVAGSTQEPIPVPVWPMNPAMLLLLSVLMASLARKTYIKTR